MPIPQPTIGDPRVTEKQWVAPLTNSLISWICQFCKTTWKVWSLKLQAFTPNKKTRKISKRYCLAKMESIPQFKSSRISTTFIFRLNRSPKTSRRPLLPSKYLLRFLKTWSSSPLIFRLVMNRRKKTSILVDQRNLTPIKIATGNWNQGDRLYVRSIFNRIKSLLNKESSRWPRTTRCLLAAFLRCNIYVKSMTSHAFQKMILVTQILCLNAYPSSHFLAKESNKNAS